MLFYEKKAWRAKYFSVFAYFIVFSTSAVEFLYAEEDRVLECQRAVVHEKDGAVGRAFHFFYHAAVIRIEDVCQRRSFLDMVAHVGHTVEDAGAARLHVDQLRFVENDRLPAHTTDHPCLPQGRCLRCGNKPCLPDLCPRI